MDKFKLPDVAIELIHQLAVDDSRSQLAIGDLTAELVDEYGGVVPKYEIRRSVAVEYGTAPSTIRDREYVCRLVPSKLRDDFPILGYHHWRSITSCKDKSKIPELARWAVETGDKQNGRPASVLQIRRHLRDGGDDTPGWLRSWTRALDILDTVRSMEDAPNAVRTLAHLWVEKAKHVSY